MRDIMTLLENTLAENEPTVEPAAEPKAEAKPGVITTHKITSAELAIIKQAALKVARGASVRKLEGGLLYKDGKESVNSFMLSDDGEGYETIDFVEWKKMKAGFPMIDGTALIDLFIQGREELLDNIQVLWIDGELAGIMNNGRNHVVWKKS